MELSSFSLTLCAVIFKMAAAVIRSSKMSKSPPADVQWTCRTSKVATFLNVSHCDFGVVYY